MQIAKAMIVLLELILIVLFLNLAGVLELGRGKFVIYTMILIVLDIIPILLVLVFKINNKWTKYVILSLLAVMSSMAYAVFSHNATILLPIPIIIARIYNDVKVAKQVEYLTIFTMFWAHIFAPVLSIVEIEPLGTRYESL